MNTEKMSDYLPTLRKIEALENERDAALAEVTQLKGITFEPGELAAHGIKTPTPGEFGAALIKRMNERWGAQVQALQAENAKLQQDCDEWKDSTVAANENQRRADAKANDMQEQRDAALARLAAMEKQEPTKAMIDAAERIDWSQSDVRGNIVNMWYAMQAAGASPVEPSLVLTALREIARGVQMDYPHKMRLDEVATIARQALAVTKAEPAQANLHKVGDLRTDVVNPMAAWPFETEASVEARQRAAFEAKGV